MRKIKIQIEKLGAIRDSEIEISPLMIFSGESGLGKSYVALLCHYIFDVMINADRINRFIKETKEWSFSAMRASLKNTGIAVTLKLQELEDWLSADAIQYMGYMLNNDSLTGSVKITFDDIEPEIPFSFEEEMVGLVENEEVYVKLTALGLTYRVKEETIDDESPFSVLLRYGLIRSVFGDFKALDDIFIFPPSRGPMLTEIITPRTGMYEKFKNGMAILERVQPHPEKVSKNLIDLFRNILDGSVKRVEEKYVYSTNGIDLPITAAAASVREIAPISLLVERLDISKAVMLLEEPEAHLHPLKQRMMADIISLINNEGAYMQITTHSDYFLRRINELISLMKLYEKLASSDEKKFEEICKDLKIDKSLKFDYKRLTAYLLKRRKDGTSIIEKQDIENGIPFASFTEAIEESLKTSYKLNDYIEEYECN